MSVLHFSHVYQELEKSPTFPIKPNILCQNFLTWQKSWSNITILIQQHLRKVGNDQEYRLNNLSKLKVGYIKIPIENFIQVKIILIKS